MSTAPFRTTVVEIYGAEVLRRRISGFSGRLYKTPTWTGLKSYLSASVHFQSEEHSRGFGWYVPESRKSKFE